MLTCSPYEQRLLCSVNDNVMMMALFYKSHVCVHTGPVVLKLHHVRGNYMKNDVVIIITTTNWYIES